MTYTVLDAQVDFQAGLRSGEEICCAVCERRAHIDGRPFDLTLAKALNFMRRYDDTHPGEFLKMAPALNEWGLNPGNVAALMRHWYLIEAEEPNEKRLDSHGKYRITDFGREFLLGKESIPRMCYTYQGDVYGYSDETNTFENGRDECVFIRDIEDFDYDQLWLRP